MMLTVWHSFFTKVKVSIKQPLAITLVKGNCRLLQLTMLQLIITIVPHEHDFLATVSNILYTIFLIFRFHLKHFVCFVSTNTHLVLMLGKVVGL